MRNGKQVIAENNIVATVIKEEDLMKIMNYNVMSMPDWLSMKKLSLPEKIIDCRDKNINNI